MAAAHAVLATPCSPQLAPATRPGRPSPTTQVRCASCGGSRIPPFPQRPILSNFQVTPEKRLQSFSSLRRRCIVRAADKEESVPSWAKPGSEEVPPWAKDGSSGYQKEGPKELPFGVYLLFSVFTAIAAVGSIYEFSNKNPIFGVIQPDSGLYAPILGFFAVTGFPTAGFLLYKAISTANKLAEAMDKEDGVNKDY